MHCSEWGRTGQPFLLQGGAGQGRIIGLFLAHDRRWPSSFHLVRNHRMFQRFRVACLSLGVQWQDGRLFRSREKYRPGQQTAHYIIPFFNYAPAAACTFWKVVNDRTLQFKWAAGERRLELLAGEGTAEGSRPVLEIQCWSESLERDNSYVYQSPRKDSKVGFSKN